ncbi:MAG: hypothetical protein LBE31_02650 [Deltaproteobacteria bacterium]|nr:hypothetical protein [Deltaproteobacteria bacterium]
MSLTDALEAAKINELARLVHKIARLDGIFDGNLETFRFWQSLQCRAPKRRLKGSQTPNHTPKLTVRIEHWPGPGKLRRCH